MRKILILAITIITLISCSPSKKEAVQYNNEVIKQQIELIEKIDDLQDSFMFFNNEEIKTKYTAANRSIELSQEFLTKLKPFYFSDSSFKTAYKQYVLDTKDVLANEYAKIIENVKIPNEEYTKENEKEYNELSDIIEDKLLKAQDDFMEAQNAFAAKYEIEIE